MTPYIAPVVQCFNCLQFGHTRKLCRAKGRCIGCGLHSHGEDKPCILKCFHCDSLEHNSLSKKCPEHKRQVIIKEIMALENKTFFETCEAVPPIPNKSRKHKIDSGTYLRKEDFPQMPEQGVRSDSVGISERREAYFQSNPRASYSGVLMSAKKRRAEDSNSSNFNWDEHNQQLIAPNGRFPHSTTPSSKIFMHAGRDSGIGMEDVFSPNQREDLSSQTLNDIVKTVAILPLQERLDVLNFMTQLISCNVSSPLHYPHDHVNTK